MVTASLVVGILVGQGLTPYVQFGVSPDYGDILDESERLSAQIKELGDFGGTQGYRDLLEENQRLIGRLEGEDTGAFRAPLESAGIGEQIGSGGGLAALTDLLTDSSCGGLSVSISGGALVVRGFVSNAGEKVALGAAISSLGPSDITDQTALLGAPYCLALGALEPAALHAPSGPVVQLAANAATGLPEVQVRASRAFDGPIYIDLVRADGTVVHMVPDPTSQVSVARPGQAFSFPVRDEFAAVSGDLVIVVSSPVPLGLDDRPAEEAAAAYYADLRRALSEQSLDPTEENAQAAFAFVP